MRSKGRATPTSAGEPPRAPEPRKPVIQVILVSPRPIARSALRLLIDQDPALRVVAEVNDLSSLAGVGVELRTNAILLIEVEEEDRVLEGLPELLRKSDRVKALLLARQPGSAAHVTAMRSGAMGVVFKERPSSSLAIAIQKVHAGEVWLDRAMMADVLVELSDVKNRHRVGFSPQPVDSLTPREREVVSLIGEGLRNKDIAARLFISQTTVRHHLTSIFGKLDVRDRSALVVFAFRHGFSHLSGPHPRPPH